MSKGKDESVKIDFKKRHGKSRGRRVEPSALKKVRKILREMPRRRDLLIEALHLIQDHYNHLPAEHLVALASEFKLAPTEVFEVATFYHHFDVVKEPDPTYLQVRVQVCDSMSCRMAGAESLITELEKTLDGKARIQRVPCVGRCQHAPVAVVGQNPVDEASPEKVSSRVQAGVIHPVLPEYVNYRSYREQGGYSTYQECVSGGRKPEQVIRILQDSNLRGLGGAGFPAGKKWSIVRSFPAPRFLAVNIDEGEPGTFKDRFFIESDPNRFLEGSLIAAWAVKLDEIYLYLRDEYAASREILIRELNALKEDPPAQLPKIHLRRGAGAYVCGEESAMIESIEGKRGMPRLRPPYIAEAGLFDRPTLEHNLETLHWVRDILEKGADWFCSEGRHGRSGLRSFSVSGRVKKPGVHIAPAGITVRELIEEYCGGMQQDHEFYGYFPGGASGGILPARLGDVPMDFDTLQEHGCFIGSAAVIIFSKQDSARDLALNSMRFFEHESCGQCTPCRVGTSKAISLMEMKKWDENLLEELAVAMEDASICGLGQAAPNPVRSVVKYFPEEIN